MTDPIVEITGGAGPEQAAAIAAVVTHLLSEEAIARARPPAPPRQSSWVVAWRPRELPPPLPSHTFDAQPWGELTESDDGDDLA